MSWQYPHLLWLTPLPVVFAFVYAAALRRHRRRIAIQFPTASLAQASASTRSRRRHLAAGAYAGAVLLSLLALAGPRLAVPTATGHPVVLIIDVSRSMEETDIRPTRIEAAKSAAVEFARHLPRASRLTLVTFGNFPMVVVPLTDDRSRLIDGIANLTTQLRTQLGPGLLEGVRAVTGEGPLPPLASGFRAVAVLLSDGRASDGLPPEEAAREAKTRGVRVYTVGLGTAADPSTFRSGYWGVLDEPTLRMIADETGGRYYKAEEAGQLREVYRGLARQIGWTRRQTDVSAIAAAMGLVLLSCAILLRFRLAPIG